LAATSPRTFLTVKMTPTVFRNGHDPFVTWIVRYAEYTLQLRSLTDGHVIRDLLRSLGTISAVPAPDGSIIAVANYDCRSQVIRINPATGRTGIVRLIPQWVQDVALSPNGRFLAYITYPAHKPCSAFEQPRHPVRTIINPGGPAEFLPNVVAIVNLATGATVRAATPDPGNPPFGLAWSPDGTRVATVGSPNSSIALLAARHPDFAEARDIEPPRGCGFVVATWTWSGLIAVRGCNKQGADLSPGKLVELTTSGRVIRAWQLAPCIDGVTAVADPTARHALLEEKLGYGNGKPCGIPRPGGYAVRITRVAGPRLRTVTTWPQGPVQISLTGW
jgi:WD40 repeat protein